MTDNEIRDDIAHAARRVDAFIGADFDLRSIVRAVCTCTRLALPFVPTDEKQPLRAIETAEAWTHGEATLKDLCEAADAVFDETTRSPAALAAGAAAYAAIAAAADRETVKTLKEIGHETAGGFAVDVAIDNASRAACVHAAKYALDLVRDSVQ
jgi:hypothetical protein